MEVKKDFKEFLELFNSHGVEYLIVGAYALALHGAPRYTGDIDVLVRPTLENAKRVSLALEEFGFVLTDVSVEDFSILNKVVQLGFPPVRIDILTSISGLSWEEAVSDQEVGVYGDIDVYFIGKAPFIANKRAIGRNKDLADIEAILRVKKS